MLHDSACNLSDRDDRLWLESLAESLIKSLAWLPLQKENKNAEIGRKNGILSENASRLRKGARIASKASKTGEGE